MLNHPVIDDVLKDRISGVTDRYGDWFSLGDYFPKVVRKSEDRPIIIDGAEVSILAIVENTTRDERGANSDITPSPVSRIKVLRAP